MRERAAGRGVRAGRAWLLCGAALSGLASPGASAQPQAQAWIDYAASPDDHPNIPNVSHAGYRGGGVTLPDGGGALEIDVTAFGATGDGVSDDTAAVRAAIDEAEARNGELPGGAVVRFPAGTYRMSGPLLIHADRVQLRGAGRAQTTLFFTESLNESYASYPGSSPGRINWSFSGGLVWFTDEDRNPYFTGVPEIGSTGDGFRLGATRDVTQAGTLGDRTVRLASASGITPGSTVVIEIDNADDLSTLRHLLGDGVWANTYTFESCCDGNILPDERGSFRVYHTVEGVIGTLIILREPLRFDLRPAWNPRVRVPQDLRREVGVADLTIQMQRDYQWTREEFHNNEPGFNGIAFSDTVDGFADNVDLVDVGGLGVLLSYAKNVTVSDVRLLSTGPDREAHHHAFVVANSADCLIERFEVRSLPFHGLYFGNFCVNNVFSNGVLDGGTFDYHKRLPYANVHTEITLRNTGEAGGAAASGPRMAARHVHWNVDARRTSSRRIAQADIMPRGALVGVRCCTPTEVISRENGDPEALIELVGPEAESPNPPNLYEAQLALRTGAPIPSSAPVAPCGACSDDEPYDFLFPGVAQNSVLTGQDGWELARDFTGTDGQNVFLETDPSFPGGGALIADSDNGRDSVISRQNDDRWALTPHRHTDTDARLRFDARAGATGGASGNVYFVLNNEQGLDEGIQFGMSPGEFQIRGGRFSGTLRETADIPAGWYTRGEWARLELRMDFTANGGDGAASLWFLNLSRGETVFRAVPGLQDVDLLGVVRYPESWDRLEFRIRNEAAAANIIPNVAALDRCCDADRTGDNAYTADDVLDFTAALASSDGSSDIDGDGGSDFVDAAAYLNIGAEGCGG